MVKFIIRKSFSYLLYDKNRTIIEKEISKRNRNIFKYNTFLSSLIILISLILLFIHNPLIPECPVENSFISKKNPNLFRNQRSVSTLFPSSHPREKRRRDKKERSFPFPPYTDRNHRLAKPSWKIFWVISSSSSSYRGLIFDLYLFRTLLLVNIFPSFIFFHLQTCAQLNSTLREMIIYDKLKK